MAGHRHVENKGLEKEEDDDDLWNGELGMEIWALKREISACCIS